MRHILMGWLLLSRVLISSLSAQDFPATRYVLAPSGLNLRSAPAAGAAKLLSLPYGAAVEQLGVAEGSSITVDGIIGGMAPLTYAGQKGFAFAGFLSRYPAPQGEKGAQAYVALARSKGLDVNYERCSRDYDGYYQEEESLALYQASWEEAFLLAKQLFNLPTGIDFPLYGPEMVETIPNPEQDPNLWEDSLDLEWIGPGQLARMTYYQRGEGFGTTLIIEPDEAYTDRLKIRHISIAD